MKRGQPLVLVALFAGAVMWVAPPPALAQTYRCRIRLQDETVYVAVDDTQLRVAATPEGLETAEPVKPTRAGQTGQQVLAVYPPVELPKPADAEEDDPPILATFAYRGGLHDPPTLRGILEMLRLEADGNVWIYQRSIQSELEATAPQDAPMASVASATNRMRLTGYFGRIRVDIGNVVYIAVDGAQMKVATTLEGLVRADPIRARRSSRRGRYIHATFPPIALPKPEGADPDAPPVMANFTYQVISDHSGHRPHFQHMLSTNVDVPRVDAQGDVWTYRQHHRIYLSPQGPLNAPMLTLADVNHLNLSMHVREVDTRTVGVAVHLLAERSFIQEVRKNGREVRVQVQIAQRDGVVVRREARPLRGLGFL